MHARTRAGRPAGTHARTHPRARFLKMLLSQAREPTSPSGARRWNQRNQQEQFSVREESCWGFSEEKRKKKKNEGSLMQLFPQQHSRQVETHMHPHTAAYVCLNWWQGRWLIFFFFFCACLNRKWEHNAGSSVQQTIAAIYLSNQMHLHSRHLSIRFRSVLSLDLVDAEQRCRSISSIKRVTRWVLPRNKTTFTTSRVFRLANRPGKGLTCGECRSDDSWYGLVRDRRKPVQQVFNGSFLTVAFVQLHNVGKTQAATVDGALQAGADAPTFTHL